MPLTLQLVVPTRVRAGEPVPIPMVLTLMNEGGESAAAWLEIGRRGPYFDLAVHRADGSLVWRRQAGQIADGTMQPVSLEPGGRLDLGHVWDQRDLEGRPAPPGAYSARAADGRGARWRVAGHRGPAIRHRALKP